MRYAVVIALVVVVLVIGTLFYKRTHRDGLGRAMKKGRPPKMRIVYSRKMKSNERPQISSSKDAYDVLRQVWSSQIETREEMYILFLDRSNSVIGYHVLSMGGITGTVADVRLIYSVALKSLATSIILAHNHPSEQLNPSKSDIDVTTKVKEAGVVMDITLLDHLIVTKHSYYSFADEGVL